MSPFYQKGDHSFLGRQFKIADSVTYFRLARSGLFSEDSATPLQR
tara:strand:- start:846 stop:980 length:135 start_codon:yes stop_codon:yes gene_type:complete